MSEFEDRNAVSGREVYEMMKDPKIIKDISEEVSKQVKLNPMRFGISTGENIRW